MLTITECREILGEVSKPLTDGEILTLRDTFYGLAEIALDSEANTKKKIACKSGKLIQP